MTDVHAVEAPTDSVRPSNPPVSPEVVARLLDLLARDHLARARQLRRMAAVCRPSLAPLEQAMWRRASECEFSGQGLELLAEAHRKAAERARHRPRASARRRVAAGHERQRGLASLVWDPRPAATYRDDPPTPTP